MKKNKTYLLIAFSLLYACSGVAQIIDYEAANEHFKFGNYLDALKLYSKLVERNYTPNQINGNIIIALPLGDESVTIEATEYQFPTENITIAGQSDFVTSMTKQFIVHHKRIK